MTLFRHYEPCKTERFSYHPKINCQMDTSGTSTLYKLVPRKSNQLSDSFSTTNFYKPIYCFSVGGKRGGRAVDQQNVYLNIYLLKKVR